MSEQAAGEGAAAPEAVELPPQSDAAFGALMDALVSDEAGEATGTATRQDGAVAPTAPAGSPDAGGAGDGTAGLPTAGDGASGGAAGEQQGAAAPADAGAAGGDPQQPAAPAEPGDRPAAWTADAAALGPKFGELSTAFEETTAKAYQAQALEAVREEHKQYFEALEKHPRLMVGQTVPAIGREGQEVLRDTNDAREWQEAVKSILVDEVRSRASAQMDEASDFMQTVHASIELFQNNVDLVPGTKNFDVELANRFASMATPYELRVDGKLQGYSIPVQPIIDQLRTQITKERAAKQSPPPAAGSAEPQAGAPAAPAKQADPPQAGITSKAGSGSNAEDFSTLFGTIGLPHLQI